MVLDGIYDGVDGAVWCQANGVMKPVTPWCKISYGAVRNTVFIN